ncbi:MAG: hypothetical protein AN490_10300 [Anabaena sp. AL09]|nr:MAG: hypothetical protein AN490_10300 [Anabaena sp. AL09]
MGGLILVCTAADPVIILLVVSCQLLVGAKHLEDKLSVIAKNSSPNACCQLLSTNYRLFLA